MPKSLYDLDYIEQELAELRNQLNQTFKVVDGLAKIQTQFEDFGQRYQQLDVIANQEEIAELQAHFNARCAQLEKLIESKWIEIKKEISNLKNELSNTDFNISAEVIKQVNELKEKVENLKVFQAPLNEIEDKLRTELQTSIDQLSADGFNHQNLEKQESLEHQLQTAKSFLKDLERQVQKLERQLRNLEKQLRVMSKWVIIAVLTTVVSLSLALGLAAIRIL
jgi:chromosome segregation ATPase